MRTNIDIDDDLMARAMSAGPYSTKKDAVEAGLKLLARQAAYREVLKWRGKLKWEGDEAIDWTQPAAEHAVATQEPTRKANAAAPAGKRRARR
jgi:Arc/MetJ family transcription regulator